MVLQNYILSNTTEWKALRRMLAIFIMTNTTCLHTNEQ